MLAIPSPQPTALAHRSPALAAFLDDLASRPPSSPADAAARLRAAPLTPRDLAPWADFAHPVQDSYGRRLVHAGPAHELMVMSWVPGDYSAIHDHGATQWGAVRYFGAADHAVFEEREGLLRLARRGTMPAGSVSPVDHDLIHLMGNPGRRPFLSLHLYGTHAPSASITGGARIFDLLERRIQRTDGGVFYHLPESEIRRREPCPEADAETRLLHHQRMLARVERRLAAGERHAELERRATSLRAERDRVAATRVACAR